METTATPHEGVLDQRGRLPRLSTTALILFLVAVPFIGRLWLLERRGFNPDELQHLHSAWCVSQGLLPYRDYFDHHTPWLHFFLSPFLNFYDVETDFNDAREFIFLARRWMWLYAGAIIALTFWLGRLFRGSQVAWVGILFLSNIHLFFVKSLEIRPDVPALALLLASLALAICGARTGRRAYFHFLLSGFLLGASVMCTQKTLFALPGFVMAMLIYVMLNQNGGLLRSRQPGVAHRMKATCAPRFFHLLSMSTGFVLPIATTLGYFAWRDGFWDFIDLNFLWNLRWKARLSPYGVLDELVRQNPFIVVLGAIGFISSFTRQFRKKALERGDYFLVWSALSLFSGLFLIPVPHRQYALLFVPLLGLFAATMLVELWEDQRHLWQPTSSRRKEAFLRITVTGVALCLLVPLSEIYATNAVFFSLLWVLIVAVSALSLHFRRRHLALSPLLLALTVHPAMQMFQHLEWRNWSTLQNLRYVLVNTYPNEMVMDGFSGLGVFRPHAYRYFFLHNEIRLMLTDADWKDFLRELQTGDIRPKLVFMDRQLNELPGEIKGFLERNYQPVGRDPIRARLPRDKTMEWTDEGIRFLAMDEATDTSAPYVLIEDGWHDAEQDRGIWIRSSRGPRSRLQVPIQTTANYTASIRARVELIGQPVKMELTVNDRRIGERELRPGWHLYSYNVTSHSLRPGFNKFLLSYSTTPRQLDPGYRGKNSVIAVQYLELVREH